MYTDRGSLYTVSQVVFLNPVDPGTGCEGLRRSPGSAGRTILGSEILEGSILREGWNW